MADSTVCSSTPSVYIKREIPSSPPPSSYKQSVASLKRNWQGRNYYSRIEEEESDDNQDGDERYKEEESSQAVESSVTTETEDEEMHCEDDEDDEQFQSYVEENLNTFNKAINENLKEVSRLVNEKKNFMQFVLVKASEMASNLLPIQKLLTTEVPLNVPFTKLKYSFKKYLIRIGLENILKCSFNFQIVFDKQYVGYSDSVKKKEWRYTSA